ncbi:MAG TPA: DUF177 domain-containing protein [Methylomusa anaerophila]|uniref:Large ribosomal RNA subunit accumulation protein YceD n=1 Tax=Methylomusa anaerophila TaxID=1930071 RepID=A0A348AQ88_9FIRM|nr:DUF177 domain-containing protein [Methylomusa anaerophila]BBB93236.1 hypothetical protein MAMMFC1_03945 [Methylomusa anaerophila]HML86932.1 DUF177 domain-containing protein [Methylomusa anaerophila]
MKIKILPIKSSASSSQPFSFDAPIESVLAKESRDSFWASGHVKVEGFVTNKGAGSLFEVQGMVFATVNQCCSRCLEQVTVNLDLPFVADYREADSNAADVYDTTDNKDIYFFSDDEIDITELIWETLLLSEPLKILCSEDCLGLCPDCGVNLNFTTCNCRENKIDPRFLALGKLFD